MTHVCNGEIWLCDISHAIVCDLGAILDTAAPTVDAGIGAGLSAADAAGAAAGAADVAVPVVDAAGAATGAAPAADAASGLASATSTIEGGTLASALGAAQPSGAAAAIAPPAFDPAAASFGPIAAPTPGAAPLGAGIPGAGGVSAPASVALSSPDATVGFDKQAAANLAADAAGGGTPAQNALGQGAFASSGIKEPAESGFTKFLNDPLGTIGSGVVNNPGAAIGAGILGIEALNQPTIPGANTAPGKINATADQLAAQGNQLSGFLQSGTLPPGVAQGIRTATESAKATIRSQYASRGMSGSSAEAQDLAAADNAAQTQGVNVAMNLLQTGINETGLATKLYESILNQSLTQDQALSDAIAKFGGALAGGGGQTIRVQAA